MKKKMICLVLALSLLLSTGGMAALASDSNSDISHSNEQRSQVINMIEDNGQSYDEIIIFANPLLRGGSGTYNGSYDMSGGVFTQVTWNCTAKPSFTVTITPTSFSGALKTAEMTVYLEKKGFWGWSPVDESNVTLEYGGTVYLDGDGEGEYRLYLRNWSGFNAKGTFFVSYSF